jgi:hypothetical protein
MLPDVGLDKSSNRQNLRVKRDGAAAAYQLSSLTNAHLFHSISWPFFFLRFRWSEHKPKIPA